MLPPLMTVERHFFTLTLAAQAMLTVTLISGMIYLHNFFAPEQIHKAIFLLSLGSFIRFITRTMEIPLAWKSGANLFDLGTILLTIGYFGSHVIS
ncbi:ABC-transport permease [Actinobacillus equuli]|nr:ABC-transport permease [Actinobacillus equuli]